MDGKLEFTRREAMVLTVAAGAAFLDSGARADTATVNGIIFEDSDRSGKPGANNPGLAGVLVSNGKDVALTDAQGRYSLPLPGPAVIFVIKPAGYTPPIDPKTGHHRFYHIHQPDGTPAALNLAFDGVAPTGPLPASVDFGLKKQDEPDAFEVVMFTDPQPETGVELEFVREDVVDALTGANARFGFTSGDILFDDLSLYERMNAIIGSLGLPWWSVGGNHDLNYEVPDRMMSRETFKRVYGPPYYAFAFAKSVFLMLDDVDYLGTDPTKPHGAGKYQGKFDADQLAFIKAVLDHTPEDRLIVLVMHIPMRTYLDPKDPAQNLVNLKELFDLLAGRRYTFSVSGHTHTTEHHYFEAADGWSGATPHHHHVLTAVSGSWWSGPYDHRGVAYGDSRDGSPNGFHILSVDGLSYKTRFVPAKEGKPLRITVESQLHHADREIKYQYRPGQLNGSPIPVAAVPSSQLIVNVFDGGPKTKVSVHYGDRAPVDMKLTPIIDPFIDDLYERNNAVKKPWVKPEVSSHIWTAKLPHDLSAGTHCVVVEAVNEYGDKVSGRIALEVTG